MSKNPKLGCAVTQEEKELLNHLTKQTGKNQGELIGDLIKKYDEIINRKPDILLEAFNLTTDEKDEVEKALTNSNSQLDTIAKDGLLQRSRYLNSVADKQAQLESMTEEEMKTATFKGAANYRIEQAISTIIDHNNNQSEKSQKVYISKGIVFKLTGSNRQTINKYFGDREVMISDHNNKHSLTEADNRKGKGFNVEQLLGVV